MIYYWLQIEITSKINIQVPYPKMVAILVFFVCLQISPCCLIQGKIFFPNQCNNPMPVLCCRRTPINSGEYRVLSPIYMVSVASLRATLAGVTFSLLLCKIQPTFLHWDREPNT